MDVVIAWYSKEVRKKEGHTSMPFITAQRVILDHKDVGPWVESIQDALNILETGLHVRKMRLKMDGQEKQLLDIWLSTLVKIPQIKDFQMDFIIELQCQEDSEYGK